MPYPATDCSGVFSAGVVVAFFVSRATVARERLSRSRSASMFPMSKCRNTWAVVCPVIAIASASSIPPARRFVTALFLL